MAVTVIISYHFMPINRVHNDMIGVAICKEVLCLQRKNKLITAQTEDAVIKAKKDQRLISLFWVLVFISKEICMF